MNKKIISLVVAAIVIVGGFLFNLSPKTTERFAGTTNLNQLTLSAGFTTGSVNATSTATSTGAILNQVDLYNPSGELVSGISFTASTSPTTVTTAASSTFTTFIPNSGDMATIIFTNASTTGTSTTLAAGTGVSLKNATTTLVIAPGGAAMMTWVRLPNTNINILVDIFR